MPKLFCSTLYFTCHIFRTPCTIIPLLPYYLFYISLLASPIIRFSNNYSDDSTQCCQNKIRKTNVPNCLVQSSVTSQKTIATSIPLMCQYQNIALNNQICSHSWADINSHIPSHFFHFTITFLRLTSLNSLAFSYISRNRTFRQYLPLSL